MMTMAYRPHRGRDRHRTREETRELFRELVEPPAIHFEPHEVDYLHHDMAHTFQAPNEIEEAWTTASHEQEDPEGDPDRPIEGYVRA